MLEGGQVDVEAEEMEEEAVDLLVGVVGEKNMRNQSRAEALRNGGRFDRQDGGGGGCTAFKN